MNKIKTIIFSAFFSLICFGLMAQQSTVIPKAQSFDGNRVKIRWIIAGDSSLLGSTNQESSLINVWDRFVKNGFVIERRLSGSSTIQRTFTSKPDLAKLEEGIANISNKPEERNAFRILKKMIFGTKNAMYAHPENVSTEKEVRQRYFYSILASASSFKASCAAGLAVIDDDVNSGDTYEYTIRESNKADNAMAVNYSAKVVVVNASGSVQNNSPLRQASLTPIARFGNKMVELKWRWRKPNALNSYQDLYYAYYVERASEPNLTTFERITTAPFLATDLTSDTLRFVDRDTTKANSVLQNGKKYVYRLVGKTYFDEDIEAIQTVTGKCEDDTRYYPMITSEKLLPNDQVELNWTLPVESAIYRFKSFSIGRSERIYKDSLFNKIQIIGSISGTIDSTKRTAIVNHTVTAKNTTKAAYYVVIGTTKDGEDFPSFPVLVQGIDSIAPVKPINVNAIWNASSKTATITWNANTEPDLLGYKIYRCLPGGIPIAISDTAVNKKLTYTDTVKIANLKVLYYVSAIDNQYNPSKLSAPAILKIPDNDPPIKPSFGNFKINSQGQVELNIYPSASPDVASHELRRNIGTQISSLNNWTLPDKPSSYTDAGLIMGGKVSYIIEAIDSTGNKSSDTLDVDIPSVLIAKPQFTLLNSSASRIDPSIKLNWDYSVVSNTNEVREFVLLKSDVSIDPTGKLGTWKTVSGDTREFTDFSVYYERTYKYGVKAIFKDGSSSTWLYTTLTMSTICGAVKYLEETGKIEPNSNVLKEACSSIRLLPGFHAKLNSVFHGIIKLK